MIGRPFIEFMAIIATAVGILLMAVLPSTATAAIGTMIILASVVTLVWHYWVMTEPDTGSL
jgi:membrane protein implicated in regulation of membrane protease activity